MDCGSESSIGMQKKWTKLLNAHWMQFSIWRTERVKQRPRTDEEELEDYQGAFLNRSGTVLPKYVAMMRMVSRSQSWCRSVGRSTKMQRQQSALHSASCCATGEFFSVHHHVVFSIMTFVLACATRPACWCTEFSEYCIAKSKCTQQVHPRWIRRVAKSPSLLLPSTKQRRRRKVFSGHILYKMLWEGRGSPREDRKDDDGMVAQEGNEWQMGTYFSVL